MSPEFPKFVGPGTPPPVPISHLIPVAELGHDRSMDCDCQPFIYELFTDGYPAPISVEVRHNSFMSLPVAEDLLAYPLHPLHDQDHDVDRRQ
jgi:hypothetical protein